MNLKKLIDTLELQPHPEGGYYKETYRSRQVVATTDGRERAASTVIYYLLGENDKSCFHRIRSDESWFFHQGSAIEIFLIQKNNMKIITLGNNISEGEVPHALVPADTWFAARIRNNKNYALVSCVVAPGFEFSEFELAHRDKLTGEFPHLQNIIKELT